MMRCYEEDESEELEKRKADNAHLRGRQAVWLEKELALRHVLLPPIGAPPPKEESVVGTAFTGNVVCLTQFSQTALDLYAIAKKGALYGLELRDHSIRLAYGPVTHLLYESGKMLETGCVDSAVRVQLRERTFALLVHVCGLTNLRITHSKIVNVITGLRLASRINLRKLAQLPFAQVMRDDIPGRFIDSVDIGGPEVPTELRNQRFFILSRAHIIGAGATCEMAAHKAYRQLMLVLEPISKPAVARRPALKKRRVQ